MSAARLASNLDSDNTGDLLSLLEDDDSAVRYWGALGFVMRGESAVVLNRDAIAAVMVNDEAPAARIAAAEALGRYGHETDVANALEVLVGFADAEANGLYLAMQALNALDYMDERAAPVRDTIASLPDRDPAVDSRLGNYVLRLKEKILADL